VIACPPRRFQSGRRGALSPESGVRRSEVRKPIVIAKVKKKKIANVRRRRMRLWRRNEKANGSDFLKSDVGQRCSLNRLFKAQGSKKIKPSLIKVKPHFHVRQSHLSVRTPLETRSKTSSLPLFNWISRTERTQILPHLSDQSRFPRPFARILFFMLSQNSWLRG
jgi:hypothetical protein